MALLKKLDGTGVSYLSLSCMWIILCWIWKEGIVAYFKLLSQYILCELRKVTTNINQDRKPLRRY